MQVPKLKNIEIRAFRGIPILEIALDGKSLLLKGGNGTGKSSIIEALEFFFSGRVSHLEGTQGISLRRHAPHVRYKAKDLEITLTFDPGKVCLKRTLRTPPSQPKQLAGFLQAARTGTFILRRSQVLEFVESDPARRFIAIGNIMGLSGLDAMELEMMRLRDEITGTIDSDQEELEGLYGDLTRLLGAPTRTLDEAIQNLNKKGAQDGYPAMASFKEANKHAKQIFKKMKGKVEERDRAARLRGILSLAVDPVITDRELQRMDEFAGTTNRLISEGANSKVVMLDFLERGKTVLQSTNNGVCPFCGQQVDKENLMGAIEERIRSTSGLTVEASNARTDSVGIIKNLETLRDRLKSSLEAIRGIDGLEEQTTRLSALAEFQSQFIQSVVNARDLKNVLDMSEFLDKRTQIKQSFDALSAGSRNLLAKIGLTADEEKILEFVLLLGSVKNRVNDITKVERDLESQKRHYIIADLFYNKFSSVKKKKVQTIYDSLESDIQRYFEKLHPNEAGRTIKLAVFLSRRASTKLLIDSMGTSGQDPRALESEGHLDSLGICIFLAFVKKFNEDCPLIVLDDVIATIDAEHRQKLAEVLLEEFKDKQLIVTTHDEIWFEEFRGIEKAYDLESAFKNLEIISWNVDSGPRIHGHKARSERIEEKINSGDKFSAGNECRRYLESILETVCRAMEVHVLFGRTGRYDVGDLLPPARKRMLELLQGSGHEAKFETAFRELEKTAALGNLLSHNNVFASDISLEEVNSFFLAVKNLQGVFSCPTCGTFLSYSRQFEIIRCGNPKCKSPMEIQLHR